MFNLVLGIVCLGYGIYKIVTKEEEPNFCKMNMELDKYGVEWFMKEYYSPESERNKRKIYWWEKYFK